LEFGIPAHPPDTRDAVVDAGCSLFTTKHDDGFEFPVPDTGA
jgi:hypothetical protein